MKQKNKKIIIIFIIILIIDQLSKLLILNFVKDTQVVIPKLLQIDVIKNKGIAFGLNSNNFKNIIITIIILVLIINYIKKQQKFIEKNTIISLGLILGGGIGNLIDRIFRGGVIDFIKVSTFPIFNIADIAIVVGWILLIIEIIKFGIKKED